MHHVRGHERSRRGRWHPRAVAGLGALLACSVTASACTSDTESGDSRLPQADSWSSVTGGTANRSRAVADLPGQPRLLWSRPLGAPATGTAASADLDWLYQSTVSDRGCNLFSLGGQEGRKRWCTRVATEGLRITPTVDGRGSLFLPSRGAVTAVADDAEIRWTVPARGTPTTLTLLDKQHLLGITQLGVAQVLNTHTGAEVSRPVELAGRAPDVSPEYGIPWCGTGERGCPAPGPAAVDTATSTAYLTVWTPGCGAPELVALRYTGGADGRLEERWRVDLPDGRLGTPVVLADDGASVVLHAADGGLRAYSTADGARLWSHDLGYRPDFSPALLPDGALVTGGRSSTVWRGPDDRHSGDAGPAPVVAVDPRGDRPAERWRRDDLVQLADPVALPSGHVVVAVRAPGDRVEVHVLDGADGHTRTRIEVPDATGPVSGLAVDARGRLAVTTAVGTVYLYGG